MSRTHRWKCRPEPGLESLSRPDSVLLFCLSRPDSFSLFCLSRPDSFSYSVCQGQILLFLLDSGPLPTRVLAGVVPRGDCPCSHVNVIEPADCHRKEKNSVDCLKISFSPLRLTCGRSWALFYRDLSLLLSQGLLACRPAGVVPRRERF